MRLQETFMSQLGATKIRCFGFLVSCGLEGKDVLFLLHPSDKQSEVDALKSVIVKMTAEHKIGVSEQDTKLAVLLQDGEITKELLSFENKRQHRYFLDKALDYIQPSSLALSDDIGTKSYLEKAENLLEKEGRFGAPKFIVDLKAADSKVETEIFNYSPKQHYKVSSTSAQTIATEINGFICKGK